MFTQLLLADEINRAPAKTQSALLEAMQERSVTIDGTTRPLPEPFFVIATQNPIESQGTYPLPEAQLDRFLFKLDVRHPTTANEKAILASHLAGFDASALDRMGLQRVTTPEELVAMQTAIRGVRVDDSVLEYIADIVGRTRSHRSLYFGASPRASIALLAGAQAHAVAAGRDYVIPDDVKALAPAAIRHRVGLQPDAEIEGVSADDCVAEILREVRVPADDRRHQLAHLPMPLIPTLRLVVLALAPLLLGIGMAIDASFLRPMLAADAGLVLLALLDGAAGQRAAGAWSPASPRPCCRSAAPNPIRLQIRSLARRRLDVSVTDDRPADVGVETCPPARRWTRAAARPSSTT